MVQPRLATRRLLLRPFTFADARHVETLAGDARVARGSVRIPHPYPPGLAARWIACHEVAWQSGSGVYYAVTGKDSGELQGSVSLQLAERRLADGKMAYVGTLGYWLGVDYWGAGRMSEAVAALLAFAFLELGVDRIEASHASDNPASGRVMQKCGLKPQGERFDPDLALRLNDYAIDWIEIKTSIKSDIYKIIN